jgi:hypothetical protein
VTEEQRGISGLATKVIGSLPAQFLMLILINMIFIGGLIWFLDRRDSARERMLIPILAACLKGNSPIQ